MRLEDPVAIEEEILRYYQRLLGSEFMQKQDASEVLSAAMLKKVPQDVRASIVAPVTEAEIRSTLQSIHRDKVPGPDGFNSAFFHDNWLMLKKILWLVSSLLC
ncbi:hypothetical protein RHGRI_005341 [Rhododendron griersonianum]|uniref:Uncharacterized protein n=1 Tax=Rhododendron griersonianum TaxID=479676 RepID=A0AAV6LCC4_9ERIC|nr:hypothetical protein RHGRI_005341 [Rhododendron griersonianum]